MRWPGAVFFGWKVVATAFVVATFAWGMGFYGPSVFMVALHRAHGWPIAVISTAITAHFLLSAVIVAWLGEFHRRFGIARVTAAGIVAMAVGVVVWANAREPWHLGPAALLTGAGWAVTSGAAINAMLAPWFEQRRPLALSLAFNGASAGGAVFVPIWVFLIDRAGFATAAAIVALVAAALIGGLAFRYLRPTPASLGMHPDDAPPADPAAAPRRAPATRRQLLADFRVATLSGAFALALFAQIGVIAHLLARLTPVAGSAQATAMVSAATLCAVAGRTLLGWLLGDRDRRAAAAANFLMQATGVLLLAFGAGLPCLAAGCVLFGLGIGNLISLPPLIAQRELDRADVARAVALVTAINQAVFAFAPGVLGALRDATGNYAAAFLVAAVIQVGAAVLVLAGRSHRPG